MLGMRAKSALLFARKSAKSRQDKCLGGFGLSSFGTGASPFQEYLTLLIHGSRLPKRKDSCFLASVILKI
jgi:hypothetical protein